MTHNHSYMYIDLQLTRIVEWTVKCSVISIYIYLMRVEPFMIIFDTVHHICCHIIKNIRERFKNEQARVAAGAATGRLQGFAMMASIPLAIDAIVSCSKGKAIN